MSAGPFPTKAMHESLRTAVEQLQANGGGTSGGTGGTTSGPSLPGALRLGPPREARTYGPNATPTNVAEAVVSPWKWVAPGVYDRIYIPGVTATSDITGIQVTNGFPDGGYTRNVVPLEMVDIPGSGGLKAVRVTPFLFGDNHIRMTIGFRAALQLKLGALIDDQYANLMVSVRPSLGSSDWSDPTETTIQLSLLPADPIAEPGPLHPLGMPVVHKRSAMPVGNGHTELVLTDGEGPYLRTYWGGVWYAIYFQQEGGVAP